MDGERARRVLALIACAATVASARAARAAPASFAVLPPYAENAYPGAMSLTVRLLAIGDAGTQSVQVFSRSGSTFAHEATLRPVAPVSSFAGRTAASDDRIAVTSLGPAPDYLGAVHIFERAAGGWTETVKLTANTRNAFSSAIALDGDHLYLGEPSSGGAGGKVHIFARTSSGAWVRNTVLVPSDGPLAGFGGALAADRGRLIVGAEGTAAYVFDCPTPETCRQTEKLTPNPDVVSMGFGHAVAISGTRALVGAPNSLGFLFYLVPGRATLFELVGQTWQRTTDLTSETSFIAGFGYQVAFAGDRAIVGAPLFDDAPWPGYFGAVFVFDRRGASWAQRQEASLEPRNDAYFASDFGMTMAAQGDTIVSGPLQLLRTRGDRYSGGPFSIATLAIDGVVTVPALPFPHLFAMGAALLAVAIGRLRPPRASA